MSSQSNSLNVIVNPPGGEQLEPGATSQIRIVISNQSKDPMKAIEVELDLPPEINDWCKVKRTSFNLDSGRREEVVFNWVIPSDAIARDYNYDVVVDCRSPYLSAPLRYLRQLKISTPVVRQVRSTDPTFTLKPFTSSTKPIVWQREQNLSIIVLVHNRSNFVDEFRISCDLNDNWYSVRYPERIEEMGLISSGNKLSLNPNSKGQIILSIHPPPDTLAGNYQPTINLHSAVNKDLFLQDIFYLRIPPVHNLQVELQAIRSKVKQKSALYNIKFRNEGNTIRQVILRSRTADEDEFGEYQLERNEVRIPPGKVVDVGLKVAVKRKSQRSFFKAKQLEFLVEIEDKEDNPLPRYLPLRATLRWEARPFWHFLVLILIALLILVGAFFLVREIIRNTGSARVAEISEFEAEQDDYKFGENVALRWKIKNSEKLKNIKFYTENHPPGTTGIEEEYEKSELIESRKIVKRFDCKNLEKEKELDCKEVATNAATAGNYKFVLEVYSENDSDKPSDTKSFKVTIAAPDKPSVSDLKVAKDEYKPREKIDFQFEINQPETVKSIEIISRNEFSIIHPDYRQSPRDEQEISIEKLKKTFCSPKQENLLECSVPISFAKEGNNDLSIRLISNYEPHNQPQPISEQLEGSIAIEKPSIPLKIIDFRINGQTNGPVSVKIGQKITLSWKVQGEDVTVRIEGSGAIFGSRGSTVLNPYRQVTYRSIVLTATDEEGKTDRAVIDIQVESPPEPVELPQE
ncbi:MAG: hypothetical protein ACFBSE_12665 [Prochloraceae cyanobacterium]